MKTAFLLSIAFGIVTVVSVLMVWSVLGAAGVWDSINQTVQDVVGGQDAAGFDVEDYLGTPGSSASRCWWRWSTWCC